MGRCNRDCLNCKREKCKEEYTRADYFKEYRANNLDKITAYQKTYYEEHKTSNAYFIKYLDFKRMLYKARKQIGDNNLEYLLDEMEKLNRAKLCELK